MKSTLGILGFILFNLHANSVCAQDLHFNAYHTQEEINLFMRNEAMKYPNLVHFQILGSSKQGREISYVTVGTRTDAPAIYFNGTHHGNEWSSTEGILGLIDFLVTHAADPAISAYLNSYTFYLQPLVNPDGHAAQDRMDSLGRDPNRDYSWSGRADANSFKVPEIQLVKKLMEQIKPRAAAAYHSGIEEVLWPWCYSSQATSDASTLLQITKETADAMGFNRYMQSYFDYVTDGEFIDYAYFKFHTTALTVEVSTIKIPPASDLAPIVDRSVKGALAFVKAIQESDLGILPKRSTFDFERIRSQWTPSTESIRLE
jgi:hypothetical protein